MVNFGAVAGRISRLNSHAEEIGQDCGSRKWNFRIVSIVRRTGRLASPLAFRSCRVFHPASPCTWPCLVRMPLITNAVPAGEINWPTVARDLLQKTYTEKLTRYDSRKAGQSNPAAVSKINFPRVRFSVSCIVRQTRTIKGDLVGHFARNLVFVTFEYHDRDRPSRYSNRLFRSLE